MRKKTINSGSEAVSPSGGVWLDLERLARVEITSESAEHPIEYALIPDRGPGWRAALAKKAVYWRGALPIYRDLLAELRSLTPPDSDRGSVEQLWDQLEVVVDRFSMALQAAEADDEGSYMMFEIGGFERLMDARWVATRYGLRICGLTQRR